MLTTETSDEERPRSSARTREMQAHAATLAEGCCSPNHRSDERRRTADADGVTRDGHRSSASTPPALLSPREWAGGDLGIFSDIAPKL